MEPGSPSRGAGEVFRRSQALYGGSMRLRSARSFAALEKLDRPQVQVGKVWQEGTWCMRKDL